LSVGVQKKLPKLELDLSIFGGVLPAEVGLLAHLKDMTINELKVLLHRSEWCAGRPSAGSEGLSVLRVCGGILGGKSPKKGLPRLPRLLLPVQPSRALPSAGAEIELTVKGGEAG
jgi:hypothetical protein